MATHSNPRGFARYPNLEPTSAGDPDETLTDDPEGDLELRVKTSRSEPSNKKIRHKKRPARR